MTPTRKGFLVLWHRRSVLSIRGLAGSLTLTLEFLWLTFTKASITSETNKRTASSSRPRLGSQVKPTLLIQGDKIISFSRDVVRAIFSPLRNNKHFAYFDRTRYISVLDFIDNTVLHFLRPRRFGKSLTISMLEHFHGIMYKAEYDMLFKVWSSDITWFISWPIKCLTLCTYRILMPTRT